MTKLMQDSLGGNAKTLMFVNCSPSVYNDTETKNSLEYAKRVKEIKNNPTLNLETKAMQKVKERIASQAHVIEEFKKLLGPNLHSYLYNSFSSLLLFVFLEQF